MTHPQLVAMPAARSALPPTLPPAPAPVPLPGSHAAVPDTANTDAAARLATIFGCCCVGNRAGDGGVGAMTATAGESCIDESWAGSRHPTLLLGPAGVGKAHIVAAQAAQVGIHLLSIDCHQLRAETAADTVAAIKRAFGSAAASAPCVLYLQNLHALVHRPRHRSPPRSPPFSPRAPARSLQPTPLPSLPRARVGDFHILRLVRCSLRTCAGVRCDLAVTLL